MKANLEDTEGWTIKILRYITAGFLTVAASFLPLSAFAQTASQSSTPVTIGAWTVEKYLQVAQEEAEGKRTDKAASRYIVDCLNDIATDLDSSSNPDGTPQSPQKIAINHKMSDYIDKFFFQKTPERKDHYLGLDGFMTAANRDGQGSKSVRTAIFSFLVRTIKEERAASSASPVTAVEKPR